MKLHSQFVMMITHIPIDLISDILSRLPAKTVVCLKIVCKSWYNLISDNDFVNCHLERSLATKTNLHFVVATPKFYLQEYDNLEEPIKQNCPVLYSADFDSLDNPVDLSHPYKNCKTPVRVIGSCRGLLLLRVKCGHLLLYNPTTQTYNVLPLLLENKPATEYVHFDYGFGYDSVSRDYKCVRIMQCLFVETGDVMFEVMVYSLRTNCWKRVPDVPCYFRPHGSDIGVLVNEVCHWVGTGIGNVYEHIVTFNLRDETFSRLPLPNLLQNLQFEILHGLYVGMLDGCLCLSANRYPHCDLWVMKEYGVAGSWTKMFTFGTLASVNLTRPLCYSVDKKRLLLKTSLFRLHCFDLETMKHTELMFADWNRDLDAHVYVENLLMLDYAEFIDDFHVPTSKETRKREEQEEEKDKDQELKII
ncbi:F-box protein CPR1-like [Silene latifolia]|uniref:F-box protein CPR1-like n=1 Tax=Silene latifolia TaxID=37657 RepID=UPI003D77B3FE